MKSRVSYMERNFSGITENSQPCLILSEICLRHFAPINGKG